MNEQQLVIARTSWSIKQQNSRLQNDSTLQWLSLDTLCSSLFVRREGSNHTLLQVVHSSSVSFVVKETSQNFCTEILFEFEIVLFYVSSVPEFWYRCMLSYKWIKIKYVIVVDHFKEIFRYVRKINYLKTLSQSVKIIRVGNVNRTKRLVNECRHGNGYRIECNVFMNKISVNNSNAQEWISCLN
jgi:transcriptional regulator of met regulon